MRSNLSLGTSGLANFDTRKLNYSSHICIHPEYYTSTEQVIYSKGRFRSGLYPTLFRLRDYTEVNASGYFVSYNMAIKVFIIDYIMGLNKVKELKILYLKARTIVLLLEERALENKSSSVSSKPRFYKLYGMKNSRVKEKESASHYNIFCGRNETSKQASAFKIQKALKFFYKILKDIPWPIQCPRNQKVMTIPSRFQLL